MPLRIENAIDMHCHFGPDVIGPNSPPSGVSALDAARAAETGEHRALVLKSHSFPSVQLAATLQEAVPGVRVFGGICTDYPTGGLNLDAVEAALRMGARVVWLPTLHSHQDWLNGMGAAAGFKDEGLRVTDETGAPSAVVKAIFDLVRQHDAILATGHVTAAEHYAVVKAFARQGKVLVTHAGEHLAGPRLTPEQCAELADLGAVIELTALTCTHVNGQRGKSPDEMAKMIRRVGCARCTLSTDYGWSRDMLTPAPAFAGFLEQLWREGLSETELSQMAAAKPAELLGL